MMELLVGIAAFVTALLTFFSGFGLGTLLTPVLIIFFPVEIAIALTGLVHFANNIFKLFLIGTKADRSVLLAFGLPAIVAAILGAWLLTQVTEGDVALPYHLFGIAMETSLLKILIAILLIGFSLMDLLPAFEKLYFDKKWLPFGGLLSGFFGGLSGHQGALRSAFLIKAGLSKAAFVSTVVVISSLVDFARIGVYSTRFLDANLQKEWPLLTIATLSAMAGSFLGNKMLKKITLGFIQRLVGIMLIVISITLGLGII